MTRATVGLALAALLLASAPARAEDGLRFERVQVAGSLLRGPRSEFHPGEAVVIRFDLVGVGVTSKGDLALETGIRLEDQRGRVLANEPVAAGIRSPNLFRTDRVPCFFSIPPHVAAAPGVYTATLLATDRSRPEPRQARHRVSFVLTERGFHLGNRRITLDAQGVYETRGPFRVGQTLFFCQHVVGYGVEGGRARLRLDVEVRDRQGKVVGRKEEFSRLESEVPGRPPFLLMSSFLSLTSPGSYEVRVTVTDLVLGERETAVYRITCVR